MSKQTFAERCELAQQCLPDAPYRAMLTKLHAEMLTALVQQEPVTQRFRVLGVDGDGREYWTNDHPMSNCTILEVQDLYNTPQPAQRTWVGLTLTERNQLCRDIAASTHQVRAVEAKLKEKNNGN